MLHNVTLIYHKALFVARLLIFYSFVNQSNCCYAVALQNLSTLHEAPVADVKSYVHRLSAVNSCSIPVCAKLTNVVVVVITVVVVVVLAITGTIS